VLPLDQAHPGDAARGEERQVMTCRGTDEGSGRDEPMSAVATPRRWSASSAVRLLAVVGLPLLAELALDSSLRHGEQIVAGPPGVIR
jgi:hypothetical protein